MTLPDLYKLCKKSDTSLIYLLLRFIYYKTKGKLLFLHQKTIVKGVCNIQTKSLLSVGISYYGFLHKNDTSLLNIEGKFHVNGNVALGRGCRLDVGENAIVEIGQDTFIGPCSKIIIQHGLHIGEACSISWDCQFLDEDFHQLEYDGKKASGDKKITIEDKVWIGNNVSIYKGTFVGKNSVIAAHSVVKSRFEEENVLIAGNPAKIIKRNISWK
jgi:acetyltransferase-like isoleucine patch superfamily enzyme